ncbi:MAG: hypothetical protein GXO85_02190 [Chlorobi bacterium]|nr:hypothetical protein [Chlorobiota bacterium]
MKKLIAKFKSMILDKILGPLKGYKTIITAAIVFLIGAWEWIDNSGLYGFLCDYFPWFCTVEETKFYAVMLMITGALQKALRFVTTTPVFKKE